MALDQNISHSYYDHRPYRCLYASSPWTLAFRYIGRLALPLFIFIVVEGNFILKF